MCYLHFTGGKKITKSFRTPLKKGKEVVDIEVENALLKRAMGYQYVETTKERVPVYESDTGNKIIGYTMAVTKEVTKRYAGGCWRTIYMA